MLQKMKFFGYVFIFITFLTLSYFIFINLWNTVQFNHENERNSPAFLDESSVLGKQTEFIQLDYPDHSKPLSSRIVHYNIDVELDEKNKKLLGSQKLTWINPGKQPVNEIYFHLYPNAFQSKKTSFIIESGGSLRNDEMKEDSFGSMTIHNIRIDSGAELTQQTFFIQPDDGNPNDYTLMGLKLSQSVLPGEEITLHMTFTVQLPYVFARMGYAGDFIMAGQWFPKIAAYEKKGMRGRNTEGWNLHQYHGNSEFYANFGTYDVNIKVPSNYIVAATGVQIDKTETRIDRTIDQTIIGTFDHSTSSGQELEEAGNSKTYHYKAVDVHDFAWSASPQFKVIEEVYRSENVKDVTIKLYLDPLHSDLKERYLYAAKSALNNFTDWYGEYPYPTLSIVIPPDGANGAGGMEYPTLVTAWSASEKEKDSSLERVIIHEIGHQFWYGMVASNEFEEAWLDEAFTSYAEDKVMEKEYGIRSKTHYEASYVSSPAPLKQNAWEYEYKNEYAQNVYIRGKLVLRDIEEIIGTAQMNKVLKTYFQRWKFNHPSTEDFQAVLEDVTGQEWDQYFNTFIYDNKMVDYAVQSININKIINEEQTLYKHQVLIQKNGATFHQPLSILFTFEDGTSIVKTWEGKEEHKMFTFTHSSTLNWVAIDPEHTVILENKHINNFKSTTINSETKTRWNLVLIQWIEIILNSKMW
ncbi:M1 family metallopeptidase [Chengkuizengella sediminis]|uniref:M1 family metallopeptidase n=1 Tax=Chengkuizengella sediminis TaxID=1885917 RepID=UPI00138A5E5A|nr:M1 family metallopeptidase [Chengkuizengella sediminis]NDI34823.1 M1 family metallopeptidase [Chengkuizengella sediminis]